MVQFILNNKEIKTALPPGMALLDFIRYEQGLTGTKIGCREGDCGACTILAGELKWGEVEYKSATSCLMALGNAHGKHIVTIEGINTGEVLNLVQDAFVQHGATQCGFCTPGFIVSLTGYCLQPGEPRYETAIDSVNGNICRCTGYKSIEKAVETVAGKLSQRKSINALEYAISANAVPGYFKEVADRLRIIQPSVQKQTQGNKILGGGTDLYVQQHDTIVHEPLDFVLNDPQLKGITMEGGRCIMGASTVVSEMATSEIFMDHFPGLGRFVQLVSSTPIRNMATVAGNFTNASPIGDLTIFFLALDAVLHLSSGRDIALRKFYLGYKKLDKAPDERIEKISFNLPGKHILFNVEKVCKRTHLDIASVNTAISIEMNGDVIRSCSLSAGGVGPIPLYLAESSAFLIGKKLNRESIEAVIKIAMTEISPISDARGTAVYKRLLLSQLIKAHFIRLFPAMETELLF